MRLGRWAGPAVVALVAAGTVALAPLAPTAADGNEAPGNQAAFRSITAGANHTCALLGGGAVKCWGANSFGQLGQGDTTSRGDGDNEMGTNLPTIALGLGRTATAIAAGGNHTCALLDNGSVKCWGANSFGQLGLGDTISRGDNAGEMGDSLSAVDLGGGRTATAITAGGNHTCARLDNGTVKCWGANNKGQLGQGDTAQRGDGAGEMGDFLAEVALGTGRTATALTAGFDFTCARLDNGSVKCWGGNTNGQLGLGDPAHRGDGPNEMGDNLPIVALGTGRSATALAAGDSHTCALLDDGNVKCWGANGKGQLGIGDTASRGEGQGEMGDNLPAVSLGTGRTATAVTAGAGHSCARLDDATVKCWGFNSSGQLGLGDNVNRGDNAGELGDALFSVNLGTGRTVTAMTAGGNHTCALLDNNRLKCWGLNASGQVGLGNVSNRGDGANEMGVNLPAIVLGVGVVTGSVIDSVSGAPVAGAWVAALRASDFAVAGGAVTNGSGAYTTSALAPGSYFLYLVDPTAAHTDGFFGPPTTVTVTEAGTATANPTMAPTRGVISGTVTDATSGLGVAGAEVITIGSTGAMAGGAVTAGNGTYTIAGLRPGSYRVGFVDPAGGRRLEYHDNSPDFAGATPVAVTAGATTTVNAALTNPTPLVAVTAGAGHACAIVGDGAVRCWGANADGQLGLGDTNSRGDGPNEMGDNLPIVNLGTGRTATALAAGRTHTCAVLDNATVKCWGRNDVGQLGLGDSNSRGDGPNEMGDNLPIVNLGTGRTATALAAGGDVTCARLDNGATKCWGRNDVGQLGLGDTNDRGDVSGEMGNSLPAVNLGASRTAVALSTGGNHVCARLDNATTKCWGGNASGQLGLGNTANRGDGANEMGDNLPAVDLGTGRVATAVSAGGNHTCALLDNARIKCWGGGGSGRLGYEDTRTRGDEPNEMGDNLRSVSLGNSATGVTVGLRHTCARLDNATVKCWGDNGSGQVGIGSTQTAIGDQFLEMPPASVNLGSGRTVQAVDAGDDFACALLDDGSIKCWGENGSGNLGIGNIADRGRAVADMGNNLPVVSLSPRGTLSGTLRDSVTNAPLSGAFIVALRTSDFAVAGGAVANGSGDYLTTIAPGSYFLYLIDPSATHNPGFFGPPTTVTVTDGTVTDVDPTMVPNRGTLAGTITDDRNGTPNLGAWALAIGPSGIAGGTLAAANGSYTIPALPAATYRAAFLDPIGGGTLEYHSNSPDFAGATPFNVSAGATTTVDAALVHP